MSDREKHHSENVADVESSTEFDRFKHVFSKLPTDQQYALVTYYLYEYPRATINENLLSGGSEENVDHLMKSSHDTLHESGFSEMDVRRIMVNLTNEQLGDPDIKNWEKWYDKMEE